MNNVELTEEEKAAAELAKKERLARERRARELRNIKEAEETERAIEEWRFSKYEDY